MSLLLKNSSISRSGPTTIEIDCEFSEGYPQASCVLVYRQYDSSLLTVVELPRLINFPISITVDNPENYTFALFGKDGGTGIEEEPVFYAKFIDSGMSPISQQSQLCKQFIHNMRPPPLSLIDYR